MIRTRNLFISLAFISTAALTVTAHAAVNDDSSTGVSRILPGAKPAHGADETKPSIGLLGGMTTSPDQSQAGKSLGIEVGFQPYIPYGAAVELATSDQTEKLGTISRTKLLAKGNYNFGGDVPVIKYSYIGLGLGPVLDRVNGENDIELGVAPQVGFDIPIGMEPKWSLGANADYLIVGGAKSKVFAVNGVAKYWF